MNRNVIGLAACSATLLSLYGCASLDSTASKSDYVVDSGRVEQIERAARRYGIGLVWVSPPQKRVVAPGS